MTYGTLALRRLLETRCQNKLQRIWAGLRHDPGGVGKDTTLMEDRNRIKDGERCIETSNGGKGISLWLLGFLG